MSKQNNNNHANDNRSNSRYHWALAILRKCRTKLLSVNAPEAIEAAGIIGFDRALAFVTEPVIERSSASSTDAMWRRVPGCYGSGRRR